ncbi:MAG TPA: RTX toxin [Blastocatellia bacterium]|nr:RTX toxin [Blastocatellia bacterium]
MTTTPHRRRLTGRTGRLGVPALFLLSLLVPVLAAAQEPRDEKTPPRPITQSEVIEPPVLGGKWQPIGPAPKRGGQSENAQPNNGVGGAVHAIAAHPADANIVYLGTVNGGIWKSTDAASATPTWVRQTDAQTTLSIGALDLDPTDPARQTLVAGIGRFSSFSRSGGPRLGLLRTETGGGRWTKVDGGGALIGKNISGIASRGRIITISVNTADNNVFDQIGIFRSTDFGATFTQISSGTGAATGLPGGVAYDLAGDPVNPARLYTNLVFADRVGGLNGIYRSTDTGATWTKVGNAAMDALIISNTTNNIEIAAGGNNTVYVAIVNAGRAAGLFRSGDGGATWTALDVPNLHPGGQGATHLSIVADPTDPNLVYIGGDRAEIGVFGARDFSGRLFRCDASAAPGSQCVHLTHSNAVAPAGGGTLNMSSPHADSREMAFDAAGNLLEGDDGGLFRRTNPRTNQGDWFSITNNLQVFELHSIAYDSNAKIVIGGAQDNGSGGQPSPGSTIWDSIGGGDGGDVAVDAASSPGLSSRYSSSQNLGNLRRRIYNANNVLQRVVAPARQLVGGGVALQPSFVTPLRVNTVAPTRLIIGGANAVYESFDQAETIRQLTPAIPVNSGGGHPIAYGAAGNPDILYIGSRDGVWVRTQPPPAALVRSAGYPGNGTGRNVVNLVVDPRDPAMACVIDSSTVFLTRDLGNSWINITGNLPSFNPGAFRSNAFVSNASGEAVVVGSNNGIFVALASSGFTVWDRLGSGFPNVLTYHLDYNSTDDVLIAGTLGRGAWALNHPTFSAVLFTSTFDALTDGFRYLDDAFETNQPGYAAGDFTGQSGFGGGGLRIVVGDVDDTEVLDMSGGWRRTFYLTSPQAVSLSFDFKMTQTPEYESDQFSETLVRVDGRSIISVAKITGDGKGGAPVSTGPVSRVLDLGCLPAGTRAITIGVRNNKKTLASQSTELLIDNVVVKANGTCLTP